MPQRPLRHRDTVTAMPSTSSSASHSARSSARSAKNSHAVRVIARSGYAVNGLLHILIGVIALQLLLTGGESTDADQSGALQSLASTPFGGILLWIVTIGLAMLGLWLIVDGIVKGLVYLMLASTALSFALGGSSDSSGDTQGMTAQLMAAPAGVVLVFVVGLVVLAVGGYFIHKGITQGFRDDLSIPAGTAGSVITGLGVAGYVAEGIALLAVGGLFIAAAVTTDASESTGLDGALRSLLALPYGVWILGLVGGGLIAYGVYCWARARYANLG
jgi:hypothetical protein